MNKLLKFGIIAGLVAGFVKGLATTIIGVPLVFKLGLPYYHLSPPPETPYATIAANEIINSLIMGFIFGLIYAWTYKVIPKKGIWKGLVFGLFGFLIWHIRWVTLFLPYGQFSWAAEQIINGLIAWIPFGITLGVVYELLHSKYYVPKREPKIIQYDMIGGFYPGAIAGLVGGIASFFANFTFSHDFAEYLVPGHVLDLSLILGQLGGQIVFHMIWGTFLGLIFPKVYNLVPGRGIVKGLIYGLIGAFLINELTAALYWAGYGNFHISYMAIMTGGFQAIFYGLVLGYLYKPSK